MFIVPFVQASTKEFAEKRPRRKMKDREREQLSHAKKRKQMILELQVLLAKYEQLF